MQGCRRGRVLLRRGRGLLPRGHGIGGQHAEPIVTFIFIAAPVVQEAVAATQQLPATLHELGRLINDSTIFIKNQHVFLAGDVHEDAPVELPREAIAVFHRQGVTVLQGLLGDLANVSALLPGSQLLPRLPDVLVLQIQRVFRHSQHHHQRHQLLTEGRTEGRGRDAKGVPKGVPKGVILK